MDKLKDKTALLVEDEERNIFALKNYLESLGMKIKVAMDGKEAIGLLQENSKTIDIILLDMMMPVMDGYETLTALKSDYSLKQIPVIAVTARAMKEDKEKCLEYGAWDYVSKPIDLTDLINKIERWIL